MHVFVPTENKMQNEKVTFTFFLIKIHVRAQHAWIRMRDCDMHGRRRSAIMEQEAAAEIQLDLPLHENEQWDRQLDEMGESVLCALV